MWAKSLKFSLIVCALLAACPTFLVAQTGHQPNSRNGDSLKRFLQDYLGDLSDDKTEYFSALVDLKDDGILEVIVYLKSGGWCGSGGCTTLILAPEGSSYKVVAKITTTQLPIRVLATKSNGWHDIAIQVHGGGILHAYEARLSFDGKTYPSNPSTSPARRLTEKVAGKVVVPLSAEGKPLYQ